MIQVSHESHIISPSFELDNTLQYFGAVAYLAKDSGNDNLFNQAKEQYLSLANKWYTQAKSEADRKSHKNWLGGGVSYTVTSPMKFEAMIDFPLVRIFSQLPKENRIKALEYLLE